MGVKGVAGRERARGLRVPCTAGRGMRCSVAGITVREQTALKPEGT